MSLLSMQHHPHHQQGPPPPPQQLHTSRPSSVVHQQQHSSQTQTQSQSQSQAQTTQASHSPYQSNTSNNHSITQAYQSASQTPNPQDSLNNYYSHPSPYSTPGATGGYTSAGADTADMMAATQMPRAPYPPMSYHTPQSNSPASVASPSQHDQHRSIYGQQASQHMAPSMYYQPHHQYQPIHPHPSASPYAQHAHHPQQPMTSQPNMMLSHSTPQNHMAQQQQQHQGHHAAHHQQQQQQHAPQQHQQHHPQHPQHAQAHAQGGMNNSPRPKMENQLPLQLSKQPQASLNGGHPQQQQQHQQQQQQMQSPGGAGHPGGIHPNAAPGPIPATTPLVVRQDGNGVQWIAFEYSRDRVKMEYTIRCDVESVNTDELAADFKQENCVYPRACCPKEQYRGNRLTYETECNRVGWALAQLNGSLRGKRGLIQRAVDSWRNSNQDVRLRSRRVRRMAKMTTRKHGQPNSHSASPHMPGHPSPASLASVPGSLGGPLTPLDTKIMNPMGQPMHHHATGHPGAGHSAGGEVDLFHHM